MSFQKEYILKGIHVVSLQHKISYPNRQIDFLSKLLNGTCKGFEIWIFQQGDFQLFETFKWKQPKAASINYFRKSKSWSSRSGNWNSSFHLSICTRHVFAFDFVSFWSVHLNFRVPERYAYLSGPGSWNWSKPKVQGTPTVGSISTQRGLYRGDSLVPIHHLPVPGGKCWMGTTETF